MKKITIVAFVLGIIFLFNPLVSSAQTTSSNSALDSLYQTLLNLTSQINALSQTGGTAAVSTAITPTTNLVSPATVSLLTSTNIVATGGSATLSWTTTSASSCTASGGWSGTQPTSGTTIVSPTITTTYSIACTGFGFTNSQSVTVTVNQLPTLSLSYTTASYNLGDPSPAYYISWLAKNATSCVSSGGVIGWPSTTRFTSSQLKFFVASPTVFTMSCVGLGGSVSRSITVPVNPNDDKLIFTAVPSTITAGLTSSLITWSPTILNTMYGCTTTSNPNDPFWPGSLASSGGTKSVSPTVTTTYTANCTGSWGAVTKSVIVTVLPNPNPVPTVTLTASPVSVGVGSSAVLSWSSTNATSCVASGGWSGTQPTSGTTIVSPTITTTYSIACTGFGFTNSQSVTVTVNQLPTLSLSYTTASYNLGDPSPAYYISWLAKNATSCVSSGGVIGWPSTTRFTSSQLKFFVASPTVFTMSCVGLGGSVSRSITVPVNPNDDKLIFTAVPSTITAGLTSSLITWSPTILNTMYGCTTTSNPNDPFWPGSLASSGGTKSVSPTVTTTYTANCTGSWGAVTKSVIVTVLPNPNPVPTVTLTASPVSVGVGSSAVLSWSSTNATSCVASGGWTSNQNLSGSIFVTPTVTTAYTLTCSGLGGSATKSVTVTVLPKPIVTLSAALSSVPAGQSTTLTWSSINTTSCTASGAWTGTKTTAGSATVVVNATGTYTLTCTGAGGSASQAVTISAIPLPTVTITATPSTIAVGQSSTLTWSSTNATACTTSGGWAGITATSGSFVVAPISGILTYNITCTGLGGSASQSATVTVLPVPTLSLSASASSVAVGQGVTLTWSSTNATACTASGAWSSQQPTSGSAIVTVNASGTYTLTCTGAGGSASQSVTISATPIPTTSLSASPTSVGTAQPFTLSWSSTNATACFASGGWVGAQPISGNITISPKFTDIYTLTCTGAGGSVSQSVTVTVVPPTTMSFSASPTSVVAGQPATLTWSSTNATSCTALVGWSGTKALSGTQVVNPTVTTTYQLNCAGSGGSPKQSVVITVLPVPTPTLWFYPSQITWSSTNATSCVASGGWSGTQLSSGSQTILPGAGVTTTYLITCTGTGGTLSKTVTVTTQ